jgi:cell division protein FtsA
MKLNEPNLIVSLNDEKIIFFVISFNEKKNYKLIKNIILDSNGIQNGKIVDTKAVSQLIKKNINLIEDELDHFFSKAYVIINPSNINCLNISGYKKLNGSQVSKEDITYILNDIKKIISSNEDDQSLVHLFNSSFSLDSDNLDNLPIGLFGEFYNQNMTFFLVNKNVLKNIELTFNSCGVNIDRIILKPFVDGINFLLNNQDNKNFISITLESNRINISLFKNKSYVLAQDFSFGIDLIVKDISKLCSLKKIEVDSFLKAINLEEVLEKNKEACLDKLFFLNSPYRKIKYQLIVDIIAARLDEFIEICFIKNTNLNYFKKNNNAIYITIERSEYFKNIKYSFQKNKFINPKFVFGNSDENSALSTLSGTAELISKGWEKEAIPVIQPKKSLISSFFSKLFS